MSQINFVNLPKDSEFLGKTSPLDFSQVPSLLLQEEPEFSPLRIVGIRFTDTGQVFDFDARNMPLVLEEAVVAELPEKGLQLGWVSRPPLTIDNHILKLKVPKIERKADATDFAQFNKKRDTEKEAQKKAQDAITFYRLNMNLVRVEYSLDLRKAIVYFTAQNRVDFRELLKDLVHKLKARVDLRQIGARDVTKALGSIGPCGQEVCCSRFLKRFHSVNIKMAKDQEISLKPTKVAGMCGRLKCCLAYEEDAYLEARKGLPRKGGCVKCKTTGACGVVQGLDVLKKEVVVLFDDGNFQKMKASDLIEDRTLNGDGTNFKNEEFVDGMDSDSEDDLRSLEDN
ncbi:MAG: hypothetical protein COT74_00015 [Bdellovibrionales bacterium CG10_big_fil_rev_8_21_14_0_10_45_34]|nr:MAG: hypothetical protein COT74_00015 [Bdellovibrionales bacterium CG10_big_fil_rev_8_21_14_0_10_45_34]